MKTIVKRFFLAFVGITACQAFVSPSLQQRHKTGLQAAQLLEFIEPTTGVPVKLVGSMHYNPTSIQLAEDTIRNLAEKDNLGSVIIESCDIRWNTTMQTNPIIQKLLMSEMRMAHDLALEYDRPVVLGDQRINVTVDRLKQGFVETIQDLVRPVTGWPLIWSNITTAAQEALPNDDENLSLRSFFEPRLLLGAPVSLVKYPLSYVAKSPIASILFFGLLFASDSAMAYGSEQSMTAGDVMGNLAVSALETLLFSRLFLNELVAERNQVLAASILEQCRLYQTDRSWWDVRKDTVQQKKAVVAVLGMAHCNGIMKLLKEERVR